MIFFIQNYKTTKLFSDYSHPLSIVFKHLTQQILDIMGLKYSLSVLKDVYYVSGVRKMIYQRQVKEALGLIFDDDNNCCGSIKDITQKEIYDFLKHLVVCNVKINIFDQERLFIEYRNKTNVHK